jgi:hypothetical protein
MSTSKSTRSARAERIMAPEFVAGIEQLSVDEIRVRRDEARAEREYLSYLRRLLQSWEDMLAAEKGDRGEPGNFHQPLAEVLSGSLQGGSRGEAVSLSLPEEDMAEADEQLGRVLGELAFALPKTLSAEQIEQGMEALRDEERAVSADRAAVIRAHDRLQDELKARYRDDPALIPELPQDA